MARALWSMQLKDRMGIETSCLKECFCSFFCFPCEVGRESLEVDMELGVIIGPFEVTKTQPTMLEKVEKATGIDIDGDGVVGDKRLCARPARWDCGR